MSFAKLICSIYISPSIFATSERGTAITQKVLKKKKKLYSAVFSQTVPVAVLNVLSIINKGNNFS